MWKHDCRGTNFHVRTSCPCSVAHPWQFVCVCPQTTILMILQSQLSPIRCCQRHLITVNKIRKTNFGAKMSLLYHVTLLAPPWQHLLKAGLCGASAGPSGVVSRVLSARTLLRTQWPNSEPSARQSSHVHTIWNNFTLKLVLRRGSGWRGSEFQTIDTAMLKLQPQVFV